MWLFGFLLLPAILAADRESKIDNYLVKIVKDTLELIRTTEGTASIELNLAGLGIRSLSSETFDNVTDLTRLNLANNFIRNLDNDVFSKLTKLEYLSLADNELANDGLGTSPFTDLRNLKILDLTNNRNLTYFRPHLFYGLSASCDIVTRGVNIETINAFMFKHSSEPFVCGIGREIRLSWPLKWGRKTVSFSSGSTKSVDANLRVKVCIENGIVTLLDVLTADEIGRSDCKEVTIIRDINELYVRRMGIKGFAKDWYRLKNIPIFKIDFQGNDIARITPDLLNDLSSSVKVISLQDNEIERLESGKIANAHLRSLILTSNRISYIENGTFEKLPIIENILLDDNRLTDMNFVSSLPTSLEELYLGRNEITDIPIGEMSIFGNLFNLELQYNKITKLERRTLSGLSSLEHLTLANNRLVTIESGAMIDLKALIQLDVANNSIASMETGSLTGLDHIRTLDFRWNKLTQYPRFATLTFSDTVENLWMDHNEIERLETGSFVSNGLRTLTLTNNKIREIEPGTFDLPHLENLNLNDNLLSELNGDSFQGLPELNELSLSNNRIAKITEAMRNLRSVGNLNIANNPLKSLDNGSLYGLRITRDVHINVKNTSIELVQCGLFARV